MEHGLMIGQIKGFLQENQLSFLGFERDAKIIDKYRAQFLAADALFNLDHWDAFEQANPQTFINMHPFTLAQLQGRRH
jgi:hypothetical protein